MYLVCKTFLQKAVPQTSKVVVGAFSWPRTDSSCESKVGIILIVSAWPAQSRRINPRFDRVQRVANKRKCNSADRTRQNIFHHSFRVVESCSIILKEAIRNPSSATCRASSPWIFHCVCLHRSDANAHLLSIIYLFILHACLHCDVATKQ